MKKLANKIYEYLHNKFHLKEFIINILIIGIVLFVCFYEFPYVVYKPGGTIGLDSRIYLDGKNIDLGDYNMAYVSVAKANTLNIFLAKIIKDWDLKKMEEVVIDNTDYDTTFKLEKLDLKNSIDIATIIAYDRAEKDVDIKNTKNIIYLVSEDANTNLKPLDEILSVDGESMEDLAAIKSYISKLEKGQKVTIKVKENGKEKNKYAYVYEKAGVKLIGIAIYTTFDLETDPEIEIKSRSSEAGSSGGLMLTLAIYDALTEKDLTHGKKIVGTGTMDIEGKVGEIGGIKYKLLGAAKDNADIFFVPKENYKEAKKVYKDYHLKFKLVKVETFDDAINYLDSLK